MTATITDIHPQKRGNGANFVRVTFKLEDHSWAKTDLCPTFRNFARWKPLLGVGNVLSGIALKRGGKNQTVDADCAPRLVRKPPVEVKPMEQQSLSL